MSGVQQASDFELRSHLWKPQRRMVLRTINELQNVNRLIVQSPTGSGKTTVAMELFRWAASRGVGGNFYVNRKVLVPQTSAQLTAAGLRHGVRAAEYEDEFDEDAPFQVSMADSEAARVYRNSSSHNWNIHEVGEGGIVVVDEAHMQRSKVLKNLLAYYEKEGAKIVLLTATPVGMGDWADKMIVSAPLAEWRDVGALVRVYCFSASQPDMSNSKRNAEGEFVLSEDKKKEFANAIMCDVIEYFEKYQNGSPCMCYCPGVMESIWMASQFQRRGHRFVHVDATHCEIDRNQYRLDRKMWEEIVAGLKSGEFRGICSRFKVREGFDLPAAGHCIFATPVGSVSSYIQMIGRVMRSFPGKDNAIMVDHGGVYHGHGSPNMDRDWESLWRLKNHAASTLFRDEVREGHSQEPIRCPNCSMERLGGSRCPHCKYESQRGMRRILMNDGEMKEVEGELIQQRVRIKRPSTARIWEGMFWGWRRKPVNRSFAQMEAYFFQEHHYWPQRDLPFMPKATIDWKAKVPDLPLESMHQR